MRVPSKASGRELALSVTDALSSPFLPDGLSNEETDWRKIEFLGEGQSAT